MIRVLLVDDEPAALRNLEHILLGLEADILVVGKAMDGQQALALIPVQKPDVVITDIRMPVMDGVELARALHRGYPEINAIILSAYMEFEYSREALRNHVVDYLLKPVEPDDLLKLLLDIERRITARDRSKRLEELQQIVDGQAPTPDGRGKADIRSVFAALWFSCGSHRFEGNRGKSSAL